MDDRKAELLNKIEKIVELKTDIDILEANISTLKVEIIKGMAELGVETLDSFNARASIMDFERGTLNKELTQEGLEKATEGEDVTIDDCKKYKHLSFLLVKRFR